MSNKSLLQLILLFLIIVIIFVIYFLYFYAGPIKSKILQNEVMESKTLSNENSSQEEILEEIKLNNNNESIKKSSLNNKEKQSLNKPNFEIEKKKENEVSVVNETKKIKNLTKEIEYITSNKKGDVFKILAKFGRTNLENSNILDLEKVSGVILSKEKSQVYIEADYAKYNYTNQDSKFYTNVTIEYDNKIILSDNLDLLTSENIAVAYGNVILKDKKSIMKAQIITLDITTKNININSEDKIRIIKN